MEAWVKARVLHDDHLCRTCNLADQKSSPSNLVSDLRSIVVYIFWKAQNLTDDCLRFCLRTSKWHKPPVEAPVQLSPPYCFLIPPSSCIDTSSSFIDLSFSCISQNPLQNVTIKTPAQNSVLGFWFVSDRTQTCWPPPSKPSADIQGTKDHIVAWSA